MACAIESSLVSLQVELLGVVVDNKSQGFLLAEVTLFCLQSFSRIRETILIWHVAQFLFLFSYCPILSSNHLRSLPKSKSAVDLISYTHFML